MNRVFSEFKIIYTNTSFVDFLSFSPNGKLCTFTSYNGILHIIYNLSSDNYLLKSFNEHLKEITSIAHSQDNNFIATGDIDGIIIIWNSLGEKLSFFQKNKTDVNGLTFSDDGKFIYFSNAEENVNIWNLKTNRLYKVLEPKEIFRGGEQCTLDDIKNIIYIPGSGNIITLGFNTIRIKNIKNDSEKIIAKQYKVFETLAYNPVLNYLVTTERGLIKVWDINSGEIIKLIKDENYPGCIFNVAFRTDGKYLAYLNYDTIKLIEISSFKEVTIENSLPNHNFSSLAFCPDNKYLAYGIEKSGKEGINQAKIKIIQFHV